MKKPIFAIVILLHTHCFAITDGELDQLIELWMVNPEHTKNINNIKLVISLTNAQKECLRFNSRLSHYVDFCNIPNIIELIEELQSTKSFEQAWSKLFFNAPILVAEKNYTTLSNLVSQTSKQFLSEKNYQYLLGLVKMYNNLGSNFTFKTEVEYAKVLSHASTYSPFGSKHKYSQTRMGLFDLKDFENKEILQTLAKLHGGTQVINILPKDSFGALLLWDDALKANQLVEKSVAMTGSNELALYDQYGDGSYYREMEWQYYTTTDYDYNPETGECEWMEKEHRDYTEVFSGFAPSFAEERQQALNFLLDLNKKRNNRHPAKVLDEIKQVEVGCKDKVSRIEKKHVKRPTQEGLSTTDQRSQV